MSKEFEAQLSEIVSARMSAVEAARVSAAEKAKAEEQFDKQWNHVRDSIVEPILSKAVDTLKQGSVRALINKPPVRRGEAMAVPGTTGIELEVPGRSRNRDEFVLQFNPWGYGPHGRVSVKHHFKHDEMELSAITEQYVEQTILAFLKEAVLDRKP